MARARVFGARPQAEPDQPLVHRDEARHVGAVHRARPQERAEDGRVAAVTVSSTRQAPSPGSGMVSRGGELGRDVRLRTRACACSVLAGVSRRTGRPARSPACRRSWAGCTRSTRRTSPPGPGSGPGPIRPAWRLSRPPPGAARACPTEKPTQQRNTAIRARMTRTVRSRKNLRIRPRPRSALGNRRRVSGGTGG